MLKIDNSLLEEVGLAALPDAEKNSFLKHIYETLEMRVGIRLADQMSNEQLDEFEKYFEAKDDAGAFKWLETNFPNYKDIVQQEFDKLKGEVAQTAPQILTASQAQAAQVPPTATAPVAEPFQPSTPPGPLAPAEPPQPPPQPFVPPAAPAPAPAPAPEPLTPPMTPPAQTPQPAPAPPPFEPPVVNPPAPTQPAPTDPLQPPFPSQQPPAGPPVQ
jgi:hypothetical protein